MAADPPGRGRGPLSQAPDRATLTPLPWYTRTMTPSFRVAALVLTAACAAGTAAQSPSPRVPVPPIATSLGTLPGVADLPVRPDMPDVMTMEDGRTITSPDQWVRRREEMRRIVTYYATGAMPPAPGNVSGRVVREMPVLAGGAHYRLVRLSFGPGASYGFDVAIFTPRTVTERLPIVVFPTFGPTPGGTPLQTQVRPPEQGKGLDALAIPVGDQTERAAAAASPPAPALPPLPSDPEATAEAHGNLLRRGYALAMYHYQDVGEDTIGRRPDGSWAFRTSRIFPAYAGYDWGLLAGWAWGLSRCVDYLETLPWVDAGKIIALGHSRIGKAVLVAGAFDDRIAVVAPAGSGAGGTGAYRFNGTRGGGREGLADMMRKYPNWFSPHLYQFAADVDRLPYDQHWLIALAAPRAFISLEGSDDQNCVPNALRQAVAGAAPAYALLGAPSKLAVHYAGHRHGLTADDWAALLDFSDSVLFGKAVGRAFNNYPPAAGAEAPK